jgi:hypothetical protein
MAAVMECEPPAGRWGVARALIEAELKAVARHAGHDEPDAVPVVEPAVYALQLGHTRSDLKEGQGGAEGRQAPIG